MRLSIITSILALAVFAVNCKKEDPTASADPDPVFTSSNAQISNYNSYSITIGFNTSVYSSDSENGSLKPDNFSIEISNPNISVVDIVVTHNEGDTTAILSITTNAPSLFNDTYLIRPKNPIYNGDGKVMVSTEFTSGSLPIAAEPLYVSLDMYANGFEHQGVLKFNTGVYSDSGAIGNLTEDNFIYTLSANSGVSVTDFEVIHQAGSDEAILTWYMDGNTDGTEIITMVPNRIFNALGTQMQNTASISATLQTSIIISPAVDISGELSGVINFTNDTIWYLNGHVRVLAGSILNIQAGTIIKGRQGFGIDAAALFISRGAQIFANGTANNPIIFTSEIDNIELGQREGTSLSKTDNNLWGGLVILGSAPISAYDGDIESIIEGTPQILSYGKYGGSNPADNSGQLSFVSIRHGGTSIGEGNEINGLTLGGNLFFHGL
jgi:hypothetical protein